MAKLTITGYDAECNCEHCGRALKLGVKTAEKGIIGADCFVKLVAKDRTRWNGNGKPSASIIRERAIIITKGLAHAARSYNLCAHSFSFDLAAA